MLLSVSQHSPASVALDIKQAWDVHLKNFNKDSQASLRGAWHVSRLWVRADAERIIVGSTVVTLLVSLGCVIFGVAVFTCSLHLAALVMLVVFCIIMCLCCFMVVIMRWKIGAIEVLSVIVFVGFAVDYSLHIAHKYHTCKIKSVDPIDDDGTSGSTVMDSRALVTRLSSQRSSSAARCSVSCEDQTTLVPPTHLTEDQYQLLATNHPAERQERARDSLECLGGAIAGSAMTTIGSAGMQRPSFRLSQAQTLWMRFTRNPKPQGVLLSKDQFIRRRKSDLLVSTTYHPCQRQL